MQTLYKPTDEWESSLSVGKQAEKLFIPEFEKQFPGFHLRHRSNEPGKEREGDFEIAETGTLLEMKFDSYNSQNYVLEIFSDKDRKTHGGMMQAACKSCDLYAIYMPNDSKRKIHLFPCLKLLWRFISVQDEGWYHSGMSIRGDAEWFNECRIIPKNLFDDLLIRDNSDLIEFLNCRTRHVG